MAAPCNMESSILLFFIPRPRDDVANVHTFVCKRYRMEVFDMCSFVHDFLPASLLDEKLAPAA